MGSGRPRSAAEIAGLLEEAGFRSSRLVPTRMPLVVRLIVATA
jgi:demethylspheroidene O-methyltransferase